jgi:endonuclease YncB( thermonuclease family)/inosine/xanthosine triphosphate pyrophosphatase family protein
LFFPNYEEIWGISIDDATRVSLNSNFYIDFKDPKHEEKVDKFLSSLRGLVAAFKYAPILPIKNHYLNSVFDITGVALSSMTISTVPNYPFTLEVDLELLQFNHKPFLPMIKDFNQSVNWSKFRHYMGRAAGSLANTVNADFLLKSAAEPLALQNSGKTNTISDMSLDGAYDQYEISPYGAMAKDTQPYHNDVLTTNVYADWINGNGISLYIPAEVQSKIFSPDTAMFRSSEEASIASNSRSFWDKLLFEFGINVTDMGIYKNLDTVVINSLDLNSSYLNKENAAKIVDIAMAGANAKDVYTAVYDSLAADYISKNRSKLNNDSIDYIKNRKSPSELQVPALATPEATESLKKDKWSLYIASQSIKGLLDYTIRENVKAILRKQKKPIDENSTEFANLYEKEQQKFMDAFYANLYERIYKDESIKNLLGVQSIKDAQKLGLPAFTIREWEVPMMKIDLDQEKIIVNSVSLSMGNNLAKMQLQMQEEPTYQYIGSNDSMISINMTIFGESELKKIKKMFDFLSGLARLEHAAGVIGFMGIKNIICALAGIKYVLPLNYTVQTVQGYPHVYNVQLMLTDFDIFQQKRESINSDGQIALIKEFGTKKNPFLRLKQKWDMINTYPDLPLNIYNQETKQVVGSFDPDFYFRSFEMFDDDVVNNLIDPDQYTLPVGEWQQEKDNLHPEQKAYVYEVKRILIKQNGDIEKAKDYLINAAKLSADEAMRIFRIAIFDQNNEPEFENSLQSSRFIANKYPTIWKDLIDSFKDDSGVEYNFEDVKFDTRYGVVKIGDVISGSQSEIDKFNKLVADKINEASGKELPSFDPDDVDHFGIMHFIPAADSNDTKRIPAIYQTPDGGYIMGYSNREDGRFYIAQDFLRIGSDGKAIPTSKVSIISDAMVPERDKQASHTGVAGASSLTDYQNAMGGSQTNKMQALSTGGTHKGVAKHWQKMLLDTQYRDLSGRMIRAFPTYMLWLIDDMNFFAGVKLFDNFYGLQSVIDFSLVSSEDILADTLMLRISNTYSKLSKPEMTLSSLINADGASIGTTSNADIDKAITNLSSGTTQIVETLVKRSLNIKSHMNSRYVTEIEHMRLKPGVRVHLRAGYGSNPNSLQTIFNGVITEVDHGEIITVVAQSDAVELSPIINSTKKKGDSGKIDGGINTGLWMSEPRDLMIRLLSMGASRVREAFSHAMRGAVFSENKFGIRHFGQILYAPLTPEEETKSALYKQSVINAFNAVGKNPIRGTVGLGWNATANLVTGGAQLAVEGTINSVGGVVNNAERDYFNSGSDPGLQSFGGSVRTPLVGAMQTMWANFSTQRDLEIFKRNIYPGNGVGVAQFLGGDLDDGWATMATIDISEIDNKKFGYLDRLSNQSWSGLIDQSSKIGQTDAASALDKATSDNKLIDSSRAIGTSQILGAGAAAVGIALAPNILTVGLGAGLIKTMSGRGGANIMKTLGLVSDLDDDIYDEVSFRAQTYMRSVWDMFQMCARLLPNYIVAVRPFEERSTIFYGKPHWLYTSGVMPISTGFPSDEVAKNNNVSVPGYTQPDDELSRLLYSLNKELAPSSDAIASLQNKEGILSESLALIAKDMISMTGVFSPGKALKGKIIDLKDVTRNTYYKNGKPISRLPINKGKVQVGFHLPFNSTGKGTEMSMQAGSSDESLNHKQIPQLPIRYSYPFFTNRTSGVLPSLNFDKIFKENDDEDINRNINNIASISLIEKGLISKGEGQEATSLVSKKSEGSEETLDFNFNFASKLKFLGIGPLLTATAAFDPSGIYDPEGSIGQINATMIIQMPLPIISSTSLAEGVKVPGSIGGSGQIELPENLQRYYEDLDPAYGLLSEYWNDFQLNFQEWGMPKSAEDEQFYIAMRWPYDPVDAREKMKLEQSPNKSIRDEVLKKFLAMYNIKQEDLAGTPDDYKNRKVLVYNPEKRVAVVCTPAYFLWGQQDANDSNGISAIVSPDAAYYLHLLIDDKGRIVSPMENIGVVDGMVSESAQWEKIGMVESSLKECMFTFVPDSIPVGVVTSNYVPANRFELTGNAKSANDTFLIGFGAYKPVEGNLPELLPAVQTRPEFLAYGVTADNAERIINSKQLGIYPGTSYTYATDIVAEKQLSDWQKEWSRGGNWANYFEYIQKPDVIGELSQDFLFKKLEEDKKNETREEFASVYDPLDNVSVVAAGFYDEKFDNTVKVIAGDGRKIVEAQQIWDQFRFGYHNYESVKNIFQKTYGLDPDSNEESQDPIFKLITGKEEIVFEDFNADKSGSEFNTLLGADWITSINQAASVTSALDVAMNEYVDGGVESLNEENKPIINKDQGLIDLYNFTLQKKIDGIKDMVKNHFEIYQYADTADEQDVDATKTKSEEQALKLLKQIKTPKQLYLLLVGIFRQKLWSDPYARAWLVLRPDKKRYSATGVGLIANAAITTISPLTGLTLAAFDVFGNENDQWSFRPVDKIFAEFINYEREYATDSNAFIKLLKENAKAGNNAGNWVTGIMEDVDNFWDKNIGPILSAFDAALGNLLNMFRLSMAQMGYGLKELENFTKQANILNKAYNDSIYYSLGRPGTLLRAVDNPFTREYGEPVVEIREPFQRMHYLSSFTHILSNNIKENTNGVATQITAVSDGKFPVTVSLDKSAPPEKQVEKTVETGLYWDNPKGEGVFGLLHPIFHPLETARGIAKHAQGEPDELTARRVALSYLKENLKDIYGGEIIVVGNTDIRPYDLVYLADIYNRMYGIFEVEQVVHHFTPETGFITSITPNAFVTVNDPARWFMSSWAASWFSTQNLRNDTRLLLANQSTNTRLTVNGDISIENLSASLKDQMVGAMQYTHGHSALLKDIQANQLADSMPETSAQIKQLIKNSTGRQDGSAGAAIFASIVMPLATAGATAAATIFGTPLAGAAVAAAGTLITDGAWNAWKWVRDHVLDQHGCYIQYLNKNGVAMDAGLANFQGMVVGKHHSVKLLPGILGIRTKTKIAGGHAFIRSDDLLKSMGWREKEISDLVRYVSLENAIVHSELLKYSGLGPEKTGLNQSFKVIVRVTHVIDGDTIDVQDVLNPENAISVDKKPKGAPNGDSKQKSDYRIRFEGIQAAELQKLAVYPGEVALINPNSQGAKSLDFTRKALENKLIVLRINPSDPSKILTADDVEAGSIENNPKNYAVAIKTENSKNSTDRYMASIFYRTDSEREQSIINKVRGIFLKIPETANSQTKITPSTIKQGSLAYVRDKVKELISFNSVIETRFDQIYEAIYTEQANNKNLIYFKTTGPDDPLNGLTLAERTAFDALVGILILQDVYSTASEWPYVGWDEYYPDGSPVTLNWELVVNGLARVYTETLNLIKGSALIDPSKAIPIPKEVRASDETRPLYWQRTGINSPMNPAKY